MHVLGHDDPGEDVDRDRSARLLESPNEFEFDAIVVEEPQATVA